MFWMCSVYMYAYVDVQVCVPVRFTCVGPRGGYWLSSISICLTALRQGLSLNGVLLVSWGDWWLASPMCPSLQWWGYRLMQPLLAFYVDTGDLNSGPHACI